jgi:hypothetical protein
MSDHPHVEAAAPPPQPNASVLPAPSHAGPLPDAAASTEGAGTPGTLEDMQAFHASYPQAEEQASVDTTHGRLTSVESTLSDLTSAMQKVVDFLHHHFPGHNAPGTPSATEE